MHVCVVYAWCVCACVLEVDVVREKREERGATCTTFPKVVEHKVLVLPCLSPPPQDYALAIAELQQCIKMKPTLLAPLLKYLGRLNLAVSHSQTGSLSVMLYKEDQLVSFTDVLLV